MRLRHSPRRRALRLAFTLMELLVVLAIIVVLAGTGGYLYMQRLDEAKVEAAKVQLKTIEQACDTYKARYGEYPADLTQLTIFQENGDKPILEPDKIYLPWSNNTALFDYEPTGQTYNQGLKPDISFIHPEKGTVVNNANIKEK